MIVELTNESWLKCYEDYFINNNLKQVLLHTKCQGKFLTIDQLNKPGHEHSIFKAHPRPRTMEEITQIESRTNCTNPFVIDYHLNERGFMNSILNDGMLLPFIVYEKDGLYYIREGQHRFHTLKVGYREGVFSKDYKVFCLICPEYYANQRIDKKELIQGAIVPYYNMEFTDETVSIEMRYTDRIRDLYMAYVVTARTVGAAYFGRPPACHPCLRSEEDFNKWIKEGS